MRIKLKKNCSLAPHQMMIAISIIVSTSLIIGAIFLLMGAYLVLPFALLEIGIVFTAFVIHARSICDFDELELHDQHWIVRQERSGVLSEYRLNKGYFALDKKALPNATLTVHTRMQTIEFAEWLNAKDREVLFDQLRRNLDPRNS